MNSPSPSIKPHDNKLMLPRPPLPILTPMRQTIHNRMILRRLRRKVAPTRIIDKRRLPRRARRRHAPRSRPSRLPLTSRLRVRASGGGGGGPEEQKDCCREHGKLHLSVLAEFLYFFLFFFFILVCWCGMVMIGWLGGKKNPSLLLPFPREGGRKKGGREDVGGSVACELLRQKSGGFLCLLVWLAW